MSTRTTDTIPLFRVHHGRGTFGNRLSRIVFGKKGVTSLYVAVGLRIFTVFDVSGVLPQCRDRNFYKFRPEEIPDLEKIGKNKKFRVISLYTVHPQTHKVWSKTMIRISKREFTQDSRTGYGSFLFETPVDLLLIPFIFDVTHFHVESPLSFLH